MHMENRLPTRVLMLVFFILFDAIWDLSRRCHYSSSCHAFLCVVIIASIIRTYAPRTMILVKWYSAPLWNVYFDSLLFKVEEVRYLVLSDYTMQANDQMIILILTQKTCRPDQPSAALGEAGKRRRSARRLPWCVAAALPTLVPWQTSNKMQTYLYSKMCFRSVCRNQIQKTLSWPLCYALAQVEGCVLQACEPSQYHTEFCICQLAWSWQQVRWIWRSLLLKNQKPCVEVLHLWNRSTVFHLQYVDVFEHGHLFSDSNDRRCIMSTTKSTNTTTSKNLVELETHVIDSFYQIVRIFLVRFGIKLDVVYAFKTLLGVIIKFL